LGCSTDEELEMETNTIKEFTLNEEAQKRLHRMTATVIDNPNAQELAFSNYASPKNVVIIDHKGQFIEQIGEEGRGPNEIQSARFFGFDNNQNLVILDKTGAFFKHFNRETGEINSYDYPINNGISITSRNLQKCGDEWYLGIQLLGKSTYTSVPTVGIFDSKFNMLDSLGGYHPYFNGRSGILQETVIKTDCTDGLIFTVQRKIPYIQVFSTETHKLIGRTDVIPPSFMLSDKFIKMVTDPREMTRFLSEEQSLSLRIAYSDKYIFLIFRNERNIFSQPRNFNDSDHYVAVYNKKNLEYLGEAKLPGAVLGSTKDGALIMLKDERDMIIQFIEINPVTEEN
jgi:hypothetical protein